MYSQHVSKTDNSHGTAFGERELLSLVTLPVSEVIMKSETMNY